MRPVRRGLARLGAVIVETFRRAEIKHAVKPKSFRAMRNFHVMRSFHVKTAGAVRTRPALGAKGRAAACETAADRDGSRKLNGIAL
jgi:hypothetical protein